MLLQALLSAALLSLEHVACGSLLVSDDVVLIQAKKAAATLGASAAGSGSAVGGAAFGAGTWEDIFDRRKGELLSPRVSKGVREMRELASKAAGGPFANARIAFVGDSVVRYQYLNLGYHVKYGKEPPLELMQKVLTKDIIQGNSSASKEETYHRAWEHFYKRSSQLLETEQCDCYRRRFDDTVNENRYLEIPDRNASFSFFWLGGHGLHGHSRDLNCEPGTCGPPFSWEHRLNSSSAASGVGSFLIEVLMEQRPPLTHVVFGTSLGKCWSEDRLRDLFSHGRKLRKATGTEFIWRTSTGNESYAPCANTEVELAKAYGWPVLDLFSATRGLQPEDYWEWQVHFKEGASSFFNAELAKLLKAL